MEIREEGGRLRLMNEGVCLDEWISRESLLEAAAEEVRRAGMMIAAVDLFLGIRRCRVCGCTDDDCSECIERTGVPCSWVVGRESDGGPICSACVPAPPPDYGLNERGVG